MASYTAEQLEQSFGIPRASAEALLLRLNTLPESSSDGLFGSGVANNLTQLSVPRSIMAYQDIGGGVPDVDSAYTSTNPGSVLGFDVGKALGFGTSPGTSVTSPGTSVTSPGTSVTSPGTSVTSPDWGLDFTGLGPEARDIPGVSLTTPMGKVGFDAVDAGIMALSAVTGLPGLPFHIARAIFNNLGTPAPSVNALGQTAMYGWGNQTIDAYGNPVGSLSNIASEMNMGNQGYDAADDVEGMMSDAVQGFADAHGGEVGGGPGSGEPDSGGMGGGQPFQRGGIMDVGAARMDEMMNRFNLERKKDNGYQEIGAYSTQRRPGVDTSNFYLRTPEQGVPFGSFGGDTPLLNLTGNYGSSTTEVTPETVHPGISQKDIDYFNLKNLEEESTSYNAGLRATFSDGMFPEWMRRVLDLKSANVSYGRSEYEKQNTQGYIVDRRSNRSRGIGGLGEVLSGRFGNNAPTVGVQYYEPNKFDRQFSGNVNIPVGKGNLDLSAIRYINEGRDNSESYKAGFSYPFEYGTLSADAERTADGENRFGARFTIPLN